MRYGYGVGAFACLLKPRGAGDAMPLAIYKREDNTGNKQCPTGGKGLTSLKYLKNELNNLNR